MVLGYKLSKLAVKAAKLRLRKGYLYPLPLHLTDEIMTKIFFNIFKENLKQVNKNQKVSKHEETD